MTEFVHEALESIPGIDNCLLCIDGSRAGAVGRETIFRSCETCPNYANGTYRLTCEDCLYKKRGTYYVIPMKTVRKLHGFVVLNIQDKPLFQEFEPAVHNFANTVAMKIESLEQQSLLEQQVRERTEELRTANAELRKSAEEKELLLREIHHRVKNNLNVVISLLRMQLSDVDDEKVRDALQVSMDRIRSMALVHQHLYQSENLNSIHFKGFIEEFIRDIAMTYETGNNVRINAGIEDMDLHIDSAIPVSLIINELVTNALKYAFPGGAEGTIDIKIRMLPEDAFELTVRDSGVGLPPDFSIEKAGTLGTKLVQGLTEQLEGELTFLKDNGTICRIIIPLV
jgi:two-component sensor histidine kinase